MTSHTPISRSWPVSDIQTSRQNRVTSTPHPTVEVYLDAVTTVNHWEVDRTPSFVRGNNTRGSTPIKAEFKTPFLERDFHFERNRFFKLGREHLFKVNGAVLYRDHVNHTPADLNLEEPNQLTDAEKSKLITLSSPKEPAYYQLSLYYQALHELNSYIHDEYGAQISRHRLKCERVELYVEVPAPAQLKVILDRFDAAVASIFGERTRVAEDHLANDEHRVRYYWVVKVRGRKFRRQKAEIKLYLKGEYLRLEFVFINFVRASPDYSAMHDELEALGELAVGYLKRIYSQLLLEESSVPVIPLERTLIAMGVQNVKHNGRIRILISQLAIFKTYSPSKYPKEDRVGRSTLERLSDHATGILLKTKTEAVSGVGVLTFRLRDDWMERGPSNALSLQKKQPR